jgi:predicted subunit of tRNA(5-methylaminomethyl-2-thiouridylate) methyltransferase
LLSPGLRVKVIIVPFHASSYVNSVLLLSAEPFASLAAFVIVMLLFTVVLLVVVFGVVEVFFAKAASR